jgi:hypothetical protein
MIDAAFTINADAAGLSRDHVIHKPIRRFVCDHDLA